MAAKETYRPGPALEMLRSISALAEAGSRASLVHMSAEEGLRSCQPPEPFLPVGTANGQSELSYGEVARGVLMRTAGSQSKLGSAVNGAAAGLAVVTIAVLGMWLFLVSY